MPAALLNVGARKPPRSARSRIGWMIVTLVPFGAITGLLCFGAVSDWIARAQGAVPAPDFGDTVWLTIIAVMMLAMFVSWLVAGTILVREQRAAEVRRASLSERTSAAERR